MISTKNVAVMPDKKTLQTICKAISVLDAILSQEWEYRYYSYNCKWAEKEEFFEMRDGEGNQMLVLFHQEGCVINGFAHEFEQQNKKKLTKGLPAIFNAFIFGEPVKTIGTTFCLWFTDEQPEWQTGEIESYKDNSKELLSIFDGKPQTYRNWATEYFAGDIHDDGIPLSVVKKIYAGETLTEKMVLSVVNDLEDWEQLKEDLKEINYPYNFK